MESRKVAQNGVRSLKGGKQEISATFHNWRVMAVTSYSRLACAFSFWRLLVPNAHTLILLSYLLAFNMDSLARSLLKVFEDVTEPSVFIHYSEDKASESLELPETFSIKVGASPFHLQYLLLISNSRICFILC